MPGEPDTVLDRASQGLRDAPEEPRWLDISTSIVSKVRSTSRRTWPVDAVFPGPDSADTLRISDQVVRTTVRRALAGIRGAQPTDISLHVDGHRCTGMSIVVTGIYGDDLQAVGDELARRAIESVEEILGITLDRNTIDVRVDDIELGEPQS